MTKKRCSVLTHGLISSLSLLNHVITRDLRQPRTDLVPRVLVHSTSGRKVRDSLDSARGKPGNEIVLTQSKTSATSPTGLNLNFLRETKRRNDGMTCPRVESTTII